MEEISVTTSLPNYTPFDDGRYNVAVKKELKPFSIGPIEVSFPLDGDEVGL